MFPKAEGEIHDGEHDEADDDGNLDHHRGVRSAANDLVRNPDGSDGDECRHGEFVETTQPVSKIASEEESRGNGDEILERGGDIGQPRRMIEEECRRRSLGQHAKAVAESHETGIQQLAGCEPPVEDDEPGPGGAEDHSHDKGREVVPDHGHDFAACGDHDRREHDGIMPDKMGSLNADENRQDYPEIATRLADVTMSRPVIDSTTNIAPTAASGRISGSTANR